MVKKNGRAIQILCVTLCIILLSATFAYATYINTYTTVATVPNANGCAIMEGFAAGGTYTYCAKIKSDGSKQVLFRTKQSDGTTTQMTNGDTGLMYATYLGHANDIVLATISETPCMFIATMLENGNNIVKLHYNGTTYYKDASYIIQCNNQNLKISGIELLGRDSSNLYFLLYEWPGDNTGTSFYKATIGLNQTSGTIQATHAFDINYTNALVNGNPVNNIADFSHQGIGYKAGTDRLYVPFTHNNVSIVLVYDNVSTASGTINPSTDLSFRITSNAYPILFEIESCDNANGRLWFACNRKATSTDTDSDAICYFNNYAP